MMKIADSRVGVWAAVIFTVCLLLGSFAPVAAADDVLPTPTVVPGQVVSWGGPADMQEVLRPPADLTDVVAVAASDVPGGYTNLALRADGTVVGWGLDRYQEANVPDDLRDVVAIDSGAGFSLALRADGSVAAWGADDSGQIDVPADLGPVTAIAAGGYFGYRGFGVPDVVCGYALALRPDGTVVRWGRDRDGLGCDQLDDRMDPPADLTDVVAISAGSRQALALRADHTVVAWGSGVAAGLDGLPPANWSDIVAISAGSGNSLGLRSDGTVQAYGIWGEAGPPDAAGVAAISASNIDLFLNRDTTISAYPSQAGTLPSDAGYRAVSAGYGYGLAIESADASEPSLPPGTDQPDATLPALGSAVVQPSVDSNPPGTGEAFQYTASRSASADTVHLYLDDQNEAAQVIVGVYADANNEPFTLLGTGHSTTLVNGEWNSVTLNTPVTLEANEHYWLAILSPRGSGVINFRDLPSGSGGLTQISARHDLNARYGLPHQWSSGTKFANAPASAYLS
ncbi:choice-of-anchor R domain-containing protein [Microlunatus ginsengisoli]|uniref:Alpha-tubulin suppressor n=1 Tax=Microlunatus ginsengisoli TaxID=363863 RepID=A0ABP7AM43_9ACTN